MCEKKPYCNREIDECMRDEIKRVNRNSRYTTLLSCCGHSKYPKTIVVLDNSTSFIFEWFTKRPLTGRYGHETGRYAFYRRDGKKKGDHYYLPEISTSLG
jgi:hypothetical protein